METLFDTIGCHQFRLVDYRIHESHSRSAWSDRRAVDNLDRRERNVNATSIHASPISFPNSINERGEMHSNVVRRSPYDLFSF